MAVTAGMQGGWRRRARDEHAHTTQVGAAFSVAVAPQARLEPINLGTFVKKNSVLVIKPQTFGQLQQTTLVNVFVTLYMRT